ncbi:MAG: protein-export chaperone SecB [Desulfobulbaceae bacterium]|nr:protein-export chaperone SecB [Desulfobulbaceae bacterium]
MAEEQSNANSEDNMPAFRLQKMYVKDLSFENPNAPDVYTAKQSDPKVDLNLSVKNKKLENDHWEVSLAITANFTNGDDKKAVFIVEIEHAAIFLLRNIPEEHLPAVLAVECPALLFPFTRQIISQMTQDGGFQPFLMEPVNFMALYENSKKQQEKQPTQ